MIRALPDRSAALAAGLLFAVTSAACSGAPRPAAEPAPTDGMSSVRVVATMEDTRPGNVAVTPAGRIFITQHPLDAPDVRVAEVLPDGTKVPYPTPAWAGAPGPDGIGIAATIGIASDTQGVIWILDMGGDGAPARLVAWDSVGEKLVRQIHIPPATLRPDSFPQDFALDEKRGRVYIADMTFPAPGAPSRPAFIVVDIDDGTARRVLEGAAPLMPSDTDVVIDGSLVGRPLDGGGSEALRLGLNPIAIDPAFEWVYFGTINGSDIYRVRAALLADGGMAPSELEAAIERYGPKVPSDGIAVDGRGRVFITDIRAAAVGVTTPEGYRLIAQDDVKLRWPDGFALGPDGTLYVTQNHLHGHPGLNEGKDETIKPFRLVEIEL